MISVFEWFKMDVSIDIKQRFCIVVPLFIANKIFRFEVSFEVKVNKTSIFPICFSLIKSFILNFDMQ